MTTLELCARPFAVGVVGYGHEALWVVLVKNLQMQLHNFINWCIAIMQPLVLYKWMRVITTEIVITKTVKSRTVLWHYMTLYDLTFSPLTFCYSIIWCLFLGQEQDSIGGGFDIQDSFVGELSQFALFDTALEREAIANMAFNGSEKTCKAIEGNVISWTSVLDNIKGNVVKRNTSWCMGKSLMLMKLRNLSAIQLVIVFNDDDKLHVFRLLCLFWQRRLAFAICSIVIIFVFESCFISVSGNMVPTGSCDEDLCWCQNVYAGTHQWWLPSYSSFTCLATNLLCLTNSCIIWVTEECL